MRKISWVLIVALCLEILSPGILSVQQSVNALEGQQQSELLTIDSVAAKYKVSPSSIIEMLNAGYSLKDISTGLDKNEDVSKLFETLQQLFPGKGKPYEPPTVTDVTYGLEGLNPLLDLDTLANVTGNVYGIYDGTDVKNTVTSSVYGRSKRSLTSSSYDELGLKNQHVRLDQAPYSVRTGVEDISTQDGSLNLKVTDIGLPGRNGLAFNLTRSYNSNSSEFYEKSYKEKIIYETRFVPRVKVVVYKKNTTNEKIYHDTIELDNKHFRYFTFYHQIPTVILGEFSGRKDSENQYIKQTFPDTSKVWYTFDFDTHGGPYFAEVYPKGTLNAVEPIGFAGWGNDNENMPNPIDKRNTLGKGWEWNIPYLQIDKYSQYIKMPEGGVYKLDHGNSIVGYPWEDTIFSEDVSKDVLGQNSAYVLKYKNGRSYYFSKNGDLIQITDRYGNYINFKYEQKYSNSEFILKEISDPLGNKLKFDYKGTQVVVSNGTDSVVYTRATIPDTNFSSLESVKDIAGRTTYYSYQFAESKYSVIYNRIPNERNDYALIKGIHHPTGVKTVFNYDSFERNLSSGIKQLQYRVTERKDVMEYSNEVVIESNTNTFRYESDPYASYQSGEHTTIVSNGELNTSVKYKKLWNDGSPRFYNLETIQDTGTIQHITQQTYDENSGNPYPIQIVTKKRSGGAESPALTVTRQYDRDGNITSETNSMGASSVTTYDPTFALPQTVTTKFDANQQSVTRYVRNGQGSVIESKTYANAEGGPLLRHTNFEYDGFGNVMKVIANNNGKATVFRYQYGPEYQHAFLTQQDVEVTNADGQKSVIVEKAQYDPLTGRVLAYTDGLNQTTSYTYDRLGRTTSVTMPNQAQASYVYNDSTNHIMAKNTLGEVQQVWFDPLGRKVRETQGLGEVKYGYDERTSRLLWQDDAYGNRTWYSYDAFGRIKQTTYADQTSSMVEYDEVGSTVTTIDAEQNRTRSTSDILGRELMIESLQNKQNYVPIQKKEYNLAGAVVASTDGNGNRTTYKYDTLGQLLAVVDADNQQTSYQYDMLGNLVTTTYGNQQSTKKEFDELGQVIKSINGTGQIQKFYYDANSNPVRSIDRSGIATDNRFNNMNQLVQTVTGNDNVQYAYDSEGRRLSMTDHRGTTSYKYQPISGFLTEIQYPDGVRLTNSYDLNKQTGYELQAPQTNVKVDAGYDNMNRLKTLGVTSGGSAANTFGYDYLSNGQLAQQSYGTAFVSQLQYTDVKLFQLSYTRNNAVMNTFQYGYDANSNITSRNENNVGSSFTYTPLNQIKTSSEFDERYSYDARYNRLTLESSRELPIQEAQYEYDVKNRLVKATGAHNPVTYSYTGEGLLYERTENQSKTRYYYDAKSLLLAEASVGADGKAQMKYVYIHDLNGKLVGRQDAANGKMQYYQLNGHGDVVALVDEQGQKLNEYRYDIWGQPLEEKETVPNILKYSGEYWDKTTGLQYLRARWYDPSMGRFINEDTYEGDKGNPLSLNLYTYVENNPLKFIDPSGHARINSYDVMELELVLNEAMKFQSTKSEGWWRWRGYLGTEFAPVFNEADNNRFKYLYSLLTQTNSGKHSLGRAEWAKGQLLDSYAEYKQDEYNEVLAYAMIGSIGGFENSKGKGVIKNVYDSIKKAPKYPDGFQGVQNGTKKVNINNKDVIDELRSVESGQWKKVYKDGYDASKKKISIHYFESSSGKVFDVKVKSGWSNN
ncbi:RHS repeat-associated core domain-containing protein [Paenibacillus sp. UMB4589-SE434]|uniref:RHS repeat domain-containing protein n=1 Tax=Paenibacillus sp. UMB4589-SE434 TaxID=3046314 RepID=UPI00254C58C0|nr:RHS repeat-associated core domain-containing protein [Paenibacillus sp. UMB4589-SE434]MDK8182618.1 RHS repeat-associated core domain-containing protein [Paenibacillus sp. UMB4589-SE434]